MSEPVEDGSFTETECMLPSLISVRRGFTGASAPLYKGLPSWAFRQTMGGWVVPDPSERWDECVWEAAESVWGER